MAGSCHEQSFSSSLQSSQEARGSALHAAIPSITAGLPACTLHIKKWGHPGRWGGGVAPGSQRL